MGLAPNCDGGGFGLLSNSESKLGKTIDYTFGSFGEFIFKFSQTIQNIDKHDWVWLAYNKRTGDLIIRTTKNNATANEEFDELVPLLNMDHMVKEKYLKFQKDSSNQMYFLWQIINWNKVAQRLA